MSVAAEIKLVQAILWSGHAEAGSSNQSGSLLHVLLGSCNRCAEGLEEAGLALHIIQVTAPPQELSHFHAACTPGTALAGGLLVTAACYALQSGGDNLMNTECNMITCILSQQLPVNRHQRLVGR